MYQRGNNGVLERTDQAGDGWARAHREANPRWYMQDVDALMAIETRAYNTGDKFFMEYVPDGFQHREKSIRQHAVVALFDRKSCREAAFGEHGRASLSLYLHLCRALGQTQPVQPKFMFTIGKDKPPWEVIEVDPESGDVVAEHALTSANWAEVWKAAGLSDLRAELARWVLR